MSGQYAQGIIDPLLNNSFEENPSMVNLRNEPEISSLGHYYRSCPRNKIQA